MRLQPRDCVKCPAQFPTCPTCPSGQSCELRLNTCEQCASAACVASSGPTKGGSNPGAIAGGVVGAAVFLAIVGAVIWYRRRGLQSTLLARKRATTDVKKEVVARAETVLNRPDPTEKPAVEEERQWQRQQPDSTPIKPAPVPENPFSDQASINTASDRATNVIPIAYLPPSSSSALTAITDTTNFTSKTPSSVNASTITPPARPVSTQTDQSGPIRPQRGPEIEDMRLHITRPVSEAPSDLSTLAPPKAPYAPSTVSGVSGVSSRESMISTSSSILNEVPQIVTPMQANFRQVLGVQKAEVVQLSSSAPPSPGVSTRTLRVTQAPPARSPLGRTAFSAEDVEDGTEDERNPFADPGRVRPVSAKSTSTFGSPIGAEGDSRPNSVLSSNGTMVADIGNATRVQLLKPGQSSLRSTISTPYTPLRSLSPVASPRSPDFRTAGQLSPPAQSVPRSFDDDTSRRMSQSTIATSHRTSTADSILEAFPFVPPSPISMHHTSNPSTPLALRGFAAQQEQADPSLLTAPSNRHKLGISVLSSTSTASNGLGGYSFQFGALSPVLPPSPTPAANGRASLDTLALSRDVEAFPLSYDSPSTPQSSEPFVPK